MQGSANGNDNRPLVLVVDDCQDVHRLLRARLRQEDVELVPATSGAEGLTLAKSRQPAVVLLDLDMPAMDGFEVLRVLKNDPATVHIPVIVLSGLHSPQDKVTAFDLGAIDYITKPFELTELRVRVRSALRLHQLVQMLATKAQIDGLTGLWNRAFFERRWAEEHARFARHAHPLSVAFIDVDHFKSVNDTYGHPAGDAVLVGLASTLQRECRSNDVVCRYGGEEFVVIMPDTTPSDAAQVLERIRAVLAETSWSRHPERRVTFSAGVAGASGGAMVTPEQWVELADKNLYAAKRAGRDRVVVTDMGALRAAAAA